jgi:excisionase family DNA binding protein
MWGKLPEDSAGRQQSRGSAGGRPDPVVVRGQAAAVEQACAALAREVAALVDLVTELAERPAPAPLAVSVEEAARLIGVGRSKMFALVRSGEVRSVRAGGRRLVPIRALEEFLENYDGDLSG